jgi:hypothetical protein
MHDIDREYLAIARGTMLIEDELDADTQEFLELVDCEAWEVMDVDPARRWIDATAEAHRSCLPSAKVAGLGGKEMPFGKHKGTPIAAVPRSYLQWLLKQPSGDQYKSTSTFKKQLREWLRTQK